ncbi:MAG: putative RNA uridine N3 methyltransferase [Candidatus Caldarchaeales archaeon]
MPEQKEGRSFFGPPLPTPRVHVFLPSSFGTETGSLLERTARVGVLARALAVFRVEKAVIFHEDPKRPDPNARFLKTIIDYMNTAPYLRKELFPIRPELRYVGVLPPLNVPTHPESKSIPIGGIELREGLVMRRGEGYYVEAGLEKPLKLRSQRRPMSKVYLLIRRKKGGLSFRLLSRTKSPYFLGTSVEIKEGPLDRLMEGYDLRIGASRIGELVTEGWSRLESSLRNAKGNVCVVFGSYRRGLREIAEVQGLRLEQIFDFVMNFIPDQGVRTVRTEEAVYAVLSILSLVLSKRTA